MNKSTDELIASLAKNLEPKTPADSSWRFSLKWLLASSAIVALWLWLLPIRSDMLQQVESLLYSLSTLQWLLLAFVSAFIVYRERIPGMSSLWPTRIAYGLMLTLLISIVLHPVLGTLLEELFAEIDSLRGRCGPLIFGMGLTWGIVLLAWTRKGASTNPARTGAWVAISSGALAAFAMQAICTHENPLHLFMWHALPIVVLFLVGLFAGQRWLRW